MRKGLRGLKRLRRLRSSSKVVKLRESATTTLISSSETAIDEVEVATEDVVATKATLTILLSANPTTEATIR